MMGMCSGLTMQRETDLVLRHIERFIGKRTPSGEFVVLGRGGPARTIRVAAVNPERFGGGCFAAEIIFPLYAEHEFIPCGMAAQEAASEANDAVAEAIATGSGDRRLPGAKVGPRLRFGATVIPRGSAWPVYPHELGIEATPQQMRELAIVRGEDVPLGADDDSAGSPFVPIASRNRPPRFAARRR